MDPFNISSEDVVYVDTSKPSRKKKIVILASGAGTTFEAIITAIETGELPVEMKCLIADRYCGATAKANRHGAVFHLINHHAEQQERDSAMITLCQGADLIVLAGYLSILPAVFVRAFERRIINLHPSLLPKHSGKGMYGMRVHESVIADADEETGCTIHFVDEGIDTGPIIAQTIVPVTPLDTPQSLQEKLRPVEHQLLIRVIKELTSS